MIKKKTKPKSQKNNKNCCKVYDLENYIRTHKPKKFKPSIIINTEGQCISIHLEDVSCSHEWIKGEGADISIHRANYDDGEKKAGRLVGATLPYYGNPKDLKIHIC